jgi:hypothetical protein
METIYPTDYDEKLTEYNKQVTGLAEKRRKFYEENPDFPFKTMYVNVIAPPHKLIIRELK